MEHSEEFDLKDCRLQELRQQVRDGQDYDFYYRDYAENWHVGEDGLNTILDWHGCEYGPETFDGPYEAYDDEIEDEWDKISSRQKWNCWIVESVIKIDDEYYYKYERSVARRSGRIPKIVLIEIDQDDRDLLTN